MAELHVRNVPTDVLERLRDRARTEGRSMSAEVVTILRTVLDETERHATQRAAVERLRHIQQRHHLTSGAQPAEQLVREDREAR